MITEAYCSYEVAKLLKEKGFDFDNPLVIEKPLKDPLVADICTCTHQTALTWLREKSVRIYIEPCENGKGLLAFRCSIYIRNQYTFSLSYLTTDFETFEEAVEAALKYSLENLI